jgi:hypothetical protein
VGGFFQVPSPAISKNLKSTNPQNVGVEKGLKEKIILSSQ